MLNRMQREAGRAATHIVGINTRSTTPPCAPPTKTPVGHTKHYFLYSISVSLENSRLNKPLQIVAKQKSLFAKNYT